MPDYEDFVPGRNILGRDGRTWYIKDRYEARGRDWLTLSCAGRKRVVAVGVLVVMGIFGYVEIMP